MKKVIFLTALVVGLICGSVAFAWQDPCNAVGNTYTWAEDDNFVLSAWVPEDILFSPAPRCSGKVVLFDLTGNRPILMDYVGNGETITINGIPCHVTDEGELDCKVIIQPEISTTLSFGLAE
jgi:hypothetical protein